MYNLVLMKLFENSKDNKGVYLLNSNDENKFISYKNLYNKAAGYLERLHDLGVERESEIVFQIDDNETFIIAFWAAVFGSMIPVPLQSVKTDDNLIKLKNVLSILRKPVILASSKNIDKIKSIKDVQIINAHQEINPCKCDISDTDPDCTALIQFSSGSTGEPKGIELSHKNILSCIKSLVKSLNIQETDSGISWMPLTHNMGLIGFHIAMIYAKSDQYLMQTDLFLTNPLKWMEFIHNNKITITSSPNFGYKHFLRFLNNQERQWNLSHLKMIINGAEPISVELCKTFVNVLEKYGLKENVITPAYGLAEATVAVSVSKSNNALQSFVLNRKNLEIIDTINESESNFEQLTFTDVGYPIDEMEIRICDENNRDLGENKVGNIQLKSPCVMKGYYMNYKATKETFTDDKWLKTGDTGFISNKLLVVTGRKKDIIFINGKNYYPNDFENLVETLDGVQKGSVVVSSVSNDAKNEEVVLFILSDNNEKFIKLSKKIKKHINLKIGIEPKDIVPISAIPKTNSGKIQRYKLITNYLDSKTSSFANSQEKDSKKNYIFNKNFNKAESEIHQICCEELNNYELKITDNLFEYGCNSLKAATIVAKINVKLDIEISLSDIFEIYTIKEISKLVENVEKVNKKRITPYEEKEYYPLSSQQKRLYSLNYMNQENTNYNLPVVMLITGKLDIINFENTFLELIKRHDSLRTSFHLNNGEPVQIVNDIYSFKVNYNSVENINITEIINKFIKPFDLSKAPLLRVSLFNIEENKYLFLIDMHHIITDGTSMGIIIKEFAALYQRKKLSNVTFQYKDYSLWQNEMLNLNKFQSQEKYWKNVFEDKVPQINVPLDYERPLLQNFDGDKVKFMLEKNLVEKIQTLAVETSTTNYMILLAAYSILISKYSSHEDIVIGSPISGRSQIEFSNVIGMFVNTIVLRSFPNNFKKFKNYLLEVKEICLNAYENQDYQFDWLVKEIGVKKDPARNPIFDVMYNMQNMEIPEFNIDQLHIEPVEIEDKNTRFDIILVVNEKESKICFEIIYCTKLYKKETIEKMSTHFFNILKTIISLPDIKLSDICILTDEEQKALSKEMSKKIHKVDISFDI